MTNTKVLLIRLFALTLLSTTTISASADQNKEAKEIEGVLAKALDIVATGESASSVALSLKKVDLTKCPVPFREAFVAYMHEWETLASFARKEEGFDDESLRMFVKSALRCIRGDITGPLLDAMELSDAHRAEAVSINERIEKRYQHVEKIAVIHGVDLRATMISEAKQQFRAEYSDVVAAAHAGKPQQMVVLGVAYLQSKKKELLNSEAEAIRWFREAADKGSASGMVFLGEMYRDGRGVAQDAAEAIRWFRKATELGNAPAAINLGMMYETGQGVPQDVSEAGRWYQAVLANDRAGMEWKQQASTQLSNLPEASGAQQAP